ncbi:MAG: FtsX-like permease family protein [Pseudomonadota bacterium]
MYKNILVELKLALRFLFIKPRGFYRAARFFTIATIAVSVAALLVSLSAFSGYLKMVSQRYTDSTGHIVVSQTYAAPGELKEKIHSILKDKITDSKEFGYLELLVSSDKGVRGLAFEVVEKGSFDEVLRVEKYIKDGDVNCIFEKKNNMIVGVAAAEILGLRTGSKIKMLYSGKNMKSGAFLLTICGIIDYGLYDMDSRYAYISMETGRGIFPDAAFGSSLRIRLKSENDTNAAVNALENSMPPDTRVRSWKDINYGILESVKLDRLVITFILSILIAVAVFNVVATLILLVREMRHEVGMLQVLGLNMFRVTRLFFIEAVILGVSGYAAGILLWLISIIGIKKWGIIMLPQDVYLVSKIPVDARFFDMLLVLLIVLFFVCLGSILPLRYLFKKFRSEGVIYGIKSERT